MSKHLKRFSAPRYWRLQTKGVAFATKPSPGPHAGELSIPLVGIVRDLLGYARDRREAKRILQEGEVRVDQVVRKEHKYGAGLMDVISIQRTGENFRLVPDPRGLRMQPIPDAEAKIKLLRIMGKSWPMGGGLQLNLHDGSNLMLPAAEGEKYSVGDVIQVSLPERKIKDHLKIEPGNVAFLEGGKSAGQVGTIEKVTRGLPTQPTMVTLSIGGKEFQTLEEFIFVVGVKKPKIKVD